MKKKGASLVWALVMSASLLFIAVTMASFVIRESQMSVRMDESSRAYAAAESGIEWGKYCLENLNESADFCAPANLLSPAKSPVFNLNGSTYQVTIYNNGSNTKIESLGTSNGVNRKLEYIINPGTVLQEVLDPTVGTFTVSGSYVQQFDYWTEGSGFASIGVGNTIGTKAIYFKHIGDEILLEAKNDDNTDEKLRFSQNKINTTSLGINEAYALQVRIEYFKDLSAKMTVSKRTFAPEGSFSCVTPTLVLDLRNFNITSSELTRFYYASSLNKELTGNIGHAPVYVMADGVNSAYIDNMATIGIIHSIPPAPPKNYMLTVIVDRVNWGRVTSGTLICGNGETACSIQIPEKTDITLKAEGQNGHTFNSWTGLSGTLCENTTSTTCFISGGKITSNIDLTAKFN